MINEQQIHDVIRKGIARFIKEYDQPAENIQLVFKLKDDEVVFLTCVYEVPTNTVSLATLIGVNIYNPLVKMHIKKLLKRFAEDDNVSLTNINLIAGIKKENDKVFIRIRNNKELIREITNPDELR